MYSLGQQSLKVSEHTEKDKKMKTKNLVLFSIIIILVTALTGVVSALNCGDTITADTILTADLLNCGSNGIVIGANNIILNCQGYIIDGDDSGIDSGIYMSGRSGVTIKNCIITDFKYGFNLQSSPNNLITNNNANSNNEAGIVLDSSSNNIVANNNANLNNGFGIVSGASYNNNLTNNTANNNQKHGLFLYAGQNNIVNSNIFCLNNQVSGSYYDINNKDTNSGDENACDTTSGWNDIGTTGCTYSCLEFLDFDEDGVPNNLDLCPDTILRSEVDTNGCSAMQFCNLFNPLGNKKNPNRKACKNADWKNNEEKKSKDCYINKNRYDNFCMVTPNPN